MHIILPTLVMVLLSFQTLAQQSPPPPAAHESGTLVTDQIGQILFEAAERKAIETFYGHLPSGSTGEVIKEIAKAATSMETAQTQATRNTNDNETDSASNSKKQNKTSGKDKNKKMPPGLAKRNRLPPGLQKQLDRNGRLPPGLEKRELPTELVAQLPPAKEGTERVIAGNDVVLIHQATGVVLDILKDIITN